MKLDTDWPAKPLFGTPLSEQPPHELAPKRRRAVESLERLALLAEADVIAPDADGDPVMIPDDRAYRAPEDFVATILQRWMQDSPVGGLSLPPPAFSELLAGPEGGQPLPVNGKLWIKWALLPEAEDKVMLINLRTLGHVMSPIRGDIAVLHDGHCGVVTVAQCSGCRHFKMVAFTPRGGGIPTVQESTAWLSTVSHLVRVVLTAPAPEPVVSEPVNQKPVKPKTKNQQPES